MNQWGQTRLTHILTTQSEIAFLDELLLFRFNTSLND